MKDFIAEDGEEEEGEGAPGPKSARGKPAALVSSGL